MNRPDTEIRQEIETRTKFLTELAGLFIYLGFRIYGATKKHAWERTQLAIANACFDKVVEWTGITHPTNPPKAGKMQMTFEGGPAHREVRTIEICGTVSLRSGDQVYRYRRTERMRGHSTIFELERTIP